MIRRKHSLLAGQWYVNLYTAQNPTGEIRGQIPLPEPSTIALMLLAGGMVWVRPRRTARPRG